MKLAVGCACSIILFGVGYFQYLIKKPKNQKLNIVFDIDKTLMQSKKCERLSERNLKNFKYYDFKIHGNRDTYLMDLED